MLAVPEVFVRREVEMQLERIDIVLDNDISEVLKDGLIIFHHELVDTVSNVLHACKPERRDAGDGLFCETARGRQTSE